MIVQCCSYCGFCISGAAYAKLVAQKSKGMPLISISLAGLADAAAKEAVANLSLGLYKAFKNLHSLLINGCCLVFIDSCYWFLLISHRLCL